MYAHRGNFGDGPVPFDLKDFTKDVSLYNNNPTVVQGKIYDTPGNTPLNKSKGPIRPYMGKYSRGIRGD